MYVLLTLVRLPYGPAQNSLDPSDVGGGWGGDACKIWGGICGGQVIQELPFCTKEHFCFLGLLRCPTARMFEEEGFWRAAMILNQHLIRTPVSTLPGREEQVLARQNPNVSH